MKYYVMQTTFGYAIMVREDHRLATTLNQWVSYRLFEGSETECKKVLEECKRIEEEDFKKRMHEQRFLPRLVKNLKLIKEIIMEGVGLQM